jgi:hypothetical protein
VAGQAAQGTLSGGDSYCSVGSAGNTYYQPIGPVLQNYAISLLTVDSGGGGTGTAPTDHSPFGYFDIVTQTQDGKSIYVAGWAMDQDMAPLTDPIQTDISIDGQGSPRLVANKTRTDVGAAYPGYGNKHGFETTIPASAGVTHTVCAYARNYTPIGATSVAPNTTLGCKSIVLSGAPAPTGPTGAIVSALNGLCLEAHAATPTDGTPIQMWACTGSSAQQWTMMPDNTIRAAGRCLDVINGGTANRTQLQLFQCNGTGAQVWQTQTNKTLVNPQSGRCMEIIDFNVNNGAPLGIQDCHGLNNQVWTVPH